MTTGDTTNSERPPRKRWRFWARAYCRKPWEKSKAGRAWRCILDVFRWGLYFASLLIIVILICAFGIFPFGDSLREEFCLWVEDDGFSSADHLYFMYAVFLLTVIMHFQGTFEKAKFLPRIQDRPYVQSLLDRGRRASSGVEKSEECCVQEMRVAVEDLQERLDNEESIVEYDLLHLKTLLAGCASEEKIQNQAKVYLVDLKDLAYEEAHTQTKEEYWNIQHRVDALVEKLGTSDRPPADDRSGEDSRGEGREEERANSIRKLRAIVEEELIPTLSENEKLWEEGTAIVKMIRNACLVAIPLLLAAGAVPSYAGGYPLGLAEMHWAIFGIAGALVAVLRGLGQTDELEVGYELGTREVQRAWRGVGLGLMAGFLAYMLMASDFIACYVFGDCDLRVREPYPRHVLVASLAGFAFERTIDRVRAAAGT